MVYIQWKERKLMNLYQILKNEMEKHREFWNYYNVRSEDVFANESVARDFIYNFFKSGSKLWALGTWASCEHEYIQMRNRHTVNVFFLGAFLQRKIDKDIAITSEISSNYPFSYIWYLVCLAHDLGYVYEQYSKIYLELPTKNSKRYTWHNKKTDRLSFLSRKYWYQDHGLDISYVVPPFSFVSNIEKFDGDIWTKSTSTIKFNNGTIVTEPRYSEDLKNNYFYYRIDKMKILDHGIVGADELFTKLIFNYIREYREMASRDNFNGNFFEFYNENGLHFCSEHFKIFAYIADCIASHNIYMAEGNEYSKEMYKDYFLDDLLPAKYKPISYKDNPVLFILCIADTIEPSKKFQDYGNEELLKLLSIEYDANTNSLFVEMDKKLYDSSEGEAYRANIEALEEWCTIKTYVTCKIIN